MTPTVSKAYLVLLLYSHRSSAAPKSSTSEPLSAASPSILAQSPHNIPPNYVTFVTDPNGRGTISLVISCLLTLILCVWSALHLNVPEQGQTRVQSFLVNVRWIIAGVYAPELVVFTAWRQWSSARLLGSLIEILRDDQTEAKIELKRLPSCVGDQVDPELSYQRQSRSEDCLRSAGDPNGCLDVNSTTSQDVLPSENNKVQVSGLLGDSQFLKVPQDGAKTQHVQARERSLSTGSSDLRSSIDSHCIKRGGTQERHHEWTMTHGFFASTGGFAFEVEAEATDCLGMPLDKLYLPAECSRRLTLTARGMALLARCGRLPNVDKAEISDKSKANDVAKALVLIQASWMLIQVIGRLVARLPVSLLEINTIAHVMCAFLMYAMWWHKPLAPKEPFILKGDWVDSLCAYMYMSSEMSGMIDPKMIESQTMAKTMLAYLRLYSKVPELESMSFQPLMSVQDPPVEARLLRPASKLCLTELSEKEMTKAAGTAFFERRPRMKRAKVGSDIVSQRSLNRWNLATAAVESYPAIREHYLLHSHSRNRCLHFKSEELLVLRVQNWPWDDLIRDVGGLVVGMVLWLACFMYGAIHVAAWNDHFPSLVERFLWRSSSLYIGFCGGLWVVLNYIAQAWKPMNTFWERWMDGGGRWWQNVLISTPVILCGFSLIFARAFIVVEAFISIRELPATAYDTPTWTQVFPHF